MAKKSLKNKCIEYALYVENGRLACGCDCGLTRWRDERGAKERLDRVRERKARGERKIFSLSEATREMDSRVDEMHKRVELLVEPASPGRVEILLTRPETGAEPEWIGTVSRYGHGFKAHRPNGDEYGSRLYSLDAAVGAILRRIVSDETEIMCGDHWEKTLEPVGLRECVVKTKPDRGRRTKQLVTSPDQLELNWTRLGG